MQKCYFCENNIEQGMLLGFWGPNNETKPICIVCLKHWLKTDGKDTGLKNRIEKWLTSENVSFNWVHEPMHLFHCILSRENPLNTKIEIIQENNSSEIIIGFMMFLEKELTFKIYKFSKEDKEKLKRKVDDYLSSIRLDYRTGMRVGYEIISENGHYGAKYFIKINSHECDKEKLFKVINKVDEIAIDSQRFLNTIIN